MTETPTIPEQATAPAPPVIPAAPPEGPQAPAPDPAAPFGRTPSGRARSKPLSGRGPGRPKGSKNRGGGGRTTVIGAKGSSRPAAKGPTDYRPALLRASQLLTLPLSFRAPVDAWCVDAAVRGDDTPDNPGIARAVSNLAAEYPQVAAVLDRIVAAGPLSELAAATLPLAVQLLVNHNRLPLAVGAKLGAADPAVIAEHLQRQGEAMAQAQAA